MSETLWICLTNTQERRGSHAVPGRGRSATLARRIAMMCVILSVGWIIVALFV
ncbi:hypothetical protein ACIGKR_31915 [Rhodococcus qingshengii]|uniref:hypothetical protein n=1 Tax=Rhodococcus qingshengii TaxID=334542 RepID=UPI0037C5456B